MLGLYNTKMLGESGKVLRHNLPVVYFKYAQYVQENRENMNIRRKNETHQRYSETQNLK